MNTRTSSIFGATSLTFVAFAAVTACQPQDDVNKNASGGNKGSGGNGSGGSGSGGNGSGGSGSGGNGSGGSGSGGNGSGGSASGGSGSGGSTGSGGVSSELANFANVRLIVDNKCAGSGCHAVGEMPPTLVGTDDAALYKTLTTYKSSRCGNFFLVKPGSQDESAFYLAQKGGLCKDSDTTKGALLRMPYGCSGPGDCTPDENLEGARQWIASGAKGP